MSSRTAVILVFLLAAGLAALCHFNLNRPLINDEAIELQQAEGMPTDRFYFFAPPEAYPLNGVDTVETLAPYLNHFLFRVTPRLTTRARFVIPVRVVCILAFAAACALFFQTARRLWPTTGAAFFAGATLAASAYALLMNQFITRNALSLLWAAALVWLVGRWLDRSERPTRRWLIPVAVALTLALGCWTYTSFKLVIPALYGGLFATWLRFDRRTAALLPIAGSAALFVCVIAGLVAADGHSPALFFARGGYAIEGASQYLRLLGLTLISPFYYILHGGFVEGDVHVIIGRAPLSWMLAPCFVLGWGAAIATRRPFWFWTVVAWTLGMAACALGGPNLKYLYAFFPLTLGLALHGVMLVSQALEKIRPGWPRHLAPIALCLYVASEMRSVFVVTPRSDYFVMNAFPQRMAQLALDAIHRDKDALVMAQPGVGFDLLNWYLWPPADAVRVRRWGSQEELSVALAAGPPLPPGATLLVDYPAREVCAEAGKPLPASLRVINVRDPLPGQ